MNYADIRPIDVANGPGVRVSLFVSGCPHRCPGCFNPETWDFQYGQGFGEEQVRSILDLLRPGYIRGLTLLGGEPMAPANQPEVLSLVRRVRQELPGRDIWCYTGYLYEELAAGRVGPLDRELLHELDVLVDGPFLLEQKDIRLRFRGTATETEADVFLEQKDIRLRFRGSANQRILDVPRSLAAGEALWWDSPQD